VVSDLERHRPIWFGGEDRSAASMDEFYQFIREKKARKIRLPVMDMWKPFRNSTIQHAPRSEVRAAVASAEPRGLSPQKPQTAAGRQQTTRIC
jgi:hypothetical protein